MKRKFAFLRHLAQPELGPNVRFETAVGLFPQTYGIKGGV